MRVYVVILCVCFSSPLCGVALPSPVPAIANPGFEEIAGGNHATGWGWYNRATASFRSETENPHSGERCLVFSNGSDLAPEVYGRLYQHVGLLASTEYELNLWVRGEGVADGIHFTDWNSYMLNVPCGDYDWQEISMVFTTKDGQTGLNLGINVTNKCKALAIDDISLRPIGETIKGKGVSGSIFLPGQVFGDNQQVPFCGYLNSSMLRKGRLEARMVANKEEVFKKSAIVLPGKNTFEWEWNSGTVATRDVSCQIRVLNSRGKQVVSMKKTIEKISPSVLLAELDVVEERLGEFNELYQKCEAKKLALDYPAVARTMLEQFIPLARRDARKGEERRALFAIRDFNRCIDEGIAEMRAYLKRRKYVPNARRYQTGPVDIDGLSFIGPRKDSLGHESHGPVFFCGMGHFYQVRKDMHRWPGYGVNIIQVEVGPSATMPSEDEIDLEAALAIVKVLDDAAEHNVKVNILLSPHYFPAWAMEKWPHLAKGGGGFLGFCVDAPEARQVIEKFIRTVVPLFKDKPALHSFCLSNEPIFDRTAGCDNTQPMWAEYLAGTHSSVETMNERYASNYTTFEQVPITGDWNAPQFYDYAVFNQKRFAGWHRWMADIIHEIAPEVPTHAKIMWLSISNRNSAYWGVNPELFGELLEINGNDCAIWPGGDYWGISWVQQNMFYDLQRSANRKPIFNSENHIQPDGSTAYVPPEHYRTVLWQGAIHGQGATTIWVWERTVDPSEEHYASTVPFYGNVMDRPGCAQEVGKTCLDLNRFACEVTALQNAKAPVALLYSMASQSKGVGYLDALSRAYCALNFSGVKVDFITEKQLTAGKGAEYKMIIVPDATHVTEKAFHGIRELPSVVRLVLMGDSLERDQYGRERSSEDLDEILKRAWVLPREGSSEELLALFGSELARLNALSDISVLDAETGEPAWGVEWLPVQIEGRTVINIVNLLAKPVEVKILRNGKKVKTRNLLSLGGRDKVRVLEPITPVLAEVAR